MPPTRRKSKSNAKVTLACSVCLERNYTVHKSQSTAQERLVLSKFCPKCGLHTEHRETK